MPTINYLDEQYIVAWLVHHFPASHEMIITDDDLIELTTLAGKIDGILRRCTHRAIKYQQELNEEDPDGVIYDNLSNE